MMQVQCKSENLVQIFQYQVGAVTEKERAGREARWAAAGPLRGARERKEMGRAGWLGLAPPIFFKALFFFYLQKST